MMGYSVKSGKNDLNFLFNFKIFTPLDPVTHQKNSEPMNISKDSNDDQILDIQTIPFELKRR